MLAAAGLAAAATTGLLVRAKNPLPTREEAERLLLVSEALSWLGTPYALGGNGPKAMDCSGLVYRAATDASFSSPGDIPRRSRDWAAFGAPVTDSIAPGDILLFKRGQQIDHIAIALSRDCFVHAASRGPKVGVVISSLSEAYWKSSFAGARRIGGE